jgi:hypothetical protein
MRRGRQGEWGEEQRKVEVMRERWSREGNEEKGAEEFFKLSS